MSHIIQCQSLAEVRQQIDRLDQQMVALMAERGEYVKQAAGFKANPAEVPDPQRVEQIIVKVKKLAEELGGNPAVVEATYRAMISAFIQAELEEYHQRHQPS